MIPSRIWSVAVAAALLGCGDKPPKPPELSQALPNLPLPPNPTLVSRTGGANALMITLRSPSRAREVEAYYQSVLTGPGWKLLKRSTDRSGAVTMLAEQDGPPLWVRIRSNPDGTGTLVDLAGAVIGADTTAPPKPAS
jgi:hypothetical protein